MTQRSETQQPVVSTTDLTMRFRRCEALAGVDLNIRPGTVFALLGENGAGKTTLIRILTGFQKPTSGTASVAGLDPTRDTLKIRRSIGYVSDSPALYDWMRVDEIGAFAASFYPPGFVTHYRESVRRYELPVDRKLKHLSKGQRAKVALSLAVAHDPPLLIMDEPTSGLDPVVRRDFLESMIDRVAAGRTVLLSSHQISEVERVADHVAILHRGKIRVEGALGDIKESITRLTIDLDDPLAALPSPGDDCEVLAEETSGRQRRMVLRHADPAYVDALRYHPRVDALGSHSLSLEEIFVVCTHGLRSSEPRDASDSLPANHEAEPASAESIGEAS